MQGRAAGKEVIVLDDEEVAAGLLGGGLEGDAAEAEGAVLAEDVLSGGDHVRFFQGGVGGGGGEGEGLREGDGKGGGCGLEKVATFQRESPYVRREYWES